MSQTRALIRALLSQARESKSLQQYLPSKLADDKLLFSTQKSPTHFLMQNTWTKRVHFSWFVVFLKKLTPPEQQLFLTLIEPKRAQEAARLLKVDLLALSYSSFMKPFLLDELKRQIYGGIEVVDAEYLPPSALNVILDLDRKQLLKVIDLLGIYDLCADAKQILDKKQLQKIHEALSKEQLQFLNYCIKQPTKWVSAKLNLSAWDGSKKTLQHLLHSRGLFRLGRSFFQEDRNLKWYLIHSLDTGRAKIVQKVFREKQDIALVPYFKNQVLSVIKRVM